MNSSENSDDLPDAPVESSDNSKVINETAKTLDQISDELGPFDPPADFDHGEEFVPEVPRPIPKHLRRGSFSRQRRSVTIVLAALGSSFAIVAPWEIIQKLSFYILPLAYLGQVGYLMIAIAGYRILQNRFSKKRFEYVISGTPFVGRILSVGQHLTRTVNPETKQIIITVNSLIGLEYDDPETRKHEYVYYRDEISWNQATSPKYAVTVSPGEYVTLIGMPERIGTTLKVYGLLGLDPKREYLTYCGKPLAGTSPLTALLIAFLVFCGLWMLVGFLYMLKYCIPSEWSWSLGAPALLIGGGIGAIFGWMLGQSEQRSGKGTSPTVLAVIFGILGLGGGALCLGLINAIFDKSQPTYHAISILNHWQRTHNFVIRDYEIEFSDFGKANSEKSHVSYEDLARLGNAKLGAKEIRQGALGLKWVAGIHPCIWIRIKDDASPLDQQRAVSVDSRKWIRSEFDRMQVPMDAEELISKIVEETPAMDLIPVLLLADGSHISAPDELVDRAKQQLQNQLK